MGTMRHLFLLLSGTTLAFHLHAADLRPGGVFVQAGADGHSLQAAAVGLVWPWAWQRAVGSGQVGGYTEASLSRWRARDGDRRVTFDHVGLLPMFRFRADAGRSPWFVEGGIGFTYMDRRFVTADKQFSTRFNFEDVLGVGRSFGESHRHELTLRLTHFSNGGMKHPNPGQNLVRLRYAYLF